MSDSEKENVERSHETREERVERIRKSHAECRGDGTYNFTCKCSPDSVTFLLFIYDILRAENTVMKEAIKPVVGTYIKTKENRSCEYSLKDEDCILIKVYTLRKLAEVGGKNE